MTVAAIMKQRSREKQLVREVVAERRRNSIQNREAARLAAHEEHKEKQSKQAGLTSSKYSKRDVRYLKQIFDEYDLDGSGLIDRAELARALHKQKERATHVDPLHKMSLAERQAQLGRTVGQTHHTNGVFLVDFSESLFRAMDANRDGLIQFEELLRGLYPFATEVELSTMLSWVATRAAHQTPDEMLELSEEERRQIYAMFVMYDKDRSGTISRTEFRQAMRRCGLEMEETDGLFSEADLDGNDSLDLEEFTAMMREIVLSGNTITDSMLYGP